jgi:hypothetical protein
VKLVVSKMDAFGPEAVLSRGLTTALEQHAMGVRGEDGRSDADMSYRSRCDEDSKSQRIEWGSASIQRGRFRETGVRTWCGSLRVADFSGSPASAGRHAKINRYAVAVRAPPPRLHSTLSWYMYTLVAAWSSRAIC